MLFTRFQHASVACAVLALANTLTVGAAPTSNGIEMASSTMNAAHDIAPDLNADYLAAWSEVLGSDVSSTGIIEIDSTLESRSVQGLNQYVALFSRNGRFVVSIVPLLTTKSSMPDGISYNGKDIASAVARNARYIMGTSIGFDAFTVVAKNILPKAAGYNEAFAGASPLAASYGFSSTIPWNYPTEGNLKRGLDGAVENVSSESRFDIIADFTPSVALAGFLAEKFHTGELRLLNGAAVVEAEKEIEKRAACTDFNERSRLLRGRVPWDTNWDYGCYGSLSNFL